MLTRTCARRPLLAHHETRRCKSLRRIARAPTVARERGRPCPRRSLPPHRSHVTPHLPCHATRAHLAIHTSGGASGTHAPTQSTLCKFAGASAAARSRRCVDGRAVGGVAQPIPDRHEEHFRLPRVIVQRSGVPWREGRVDCLVGAKSAFRILRHNCVTTGCSCPRRSCSHLGVRAARGCADSSPRNCGMRMSPSSCWLRAALSRRACSYAVRVGWPGSGSSSRDSDARPFPFFDAAPLSRGALRLPVESGRLVGNGQF